MIYARSQLFSVASRQINHIKLHYRSTRKEELKKIIRENASNLDNRKFHSYYKSTLERLLSVMQNINDDNSSDYQETSDNILQDEIHDELIIRDLIEENLHNIEIDRKLKILDTRIAIIDERHENNITTGDEYVNKMLEKIFLKIGKWLVIPSE